MHFHWLEHNSIWLKAIPPITHGTNDNKSSHFFINKANPCKFFVSYGHRKVFLNRDILHEIHITFTIVLHLKWLMNRLIKWRSIYKLSIQPWWHERKVIIHHIPNGSLRGLHRWSSSCRTAHVIQVLKHRDEGVSTITNTHVV